MIEFIAKYNYVAVILVFAVEHYIASHKMAPNSTIELVISVIRKFFKIAPKK
jgi:hypothetical protein